MQDLHEKQANRRGPLILRDCLAYDRTRLANERTLLAWLRTGLAGFVAGLSFLRFFGWPVTDVFGWIFIVLGGIAIGGGAISFIAMRRRLHEQMDQAPRQAKP